MTKLRPSSDKGRGLFISVDGPSGVGKSTIVLQLAKLLTADGEDVHKTAEPSGSQIGTLARELTETVTGPALACLYSADRYYHLDLEIRPRLSAGQIVICDRYVPSGLVMQRFDGLAPTFLWDLNSLADPPDLAVILEAHPQTISARLAARGAHNRFQLNPGSSQAETEFFQQASEHLIRAGYKILRIDCNDKPPEELATAIRDRLRSLFPVPDRDASR